MTRASNKPFLFASQLSVERGGEEIVGPARFELLRQIDACGSITAAAQAAGVSYRTAWVAVDTLNNLAGEELVERVKGGAGGGGARLTAAGRKLVDTYAELHAKQQAFLDWVARGGSDIEHYIQMLGRLSLRTSARNQLAARVSTCVQDGLSAQVGLKLADGQSLTATISRRSRQVLGIEVGKTVVALFKISAAVIVAADHPAHGNLLRGVVGQTEATDAGTEIAIALPGGSTVHGLWPASESAPAPAVGQAIGVVVDPSAILLAVSE